MVQKVVRLLLPVDRFSEYPDRRFLTLICGIHMITAGCIAFLLTERLARLYLDTSVLFIVASATALAGARGVGLLYVRIIERRFPLHKLPHVFRGTATYYRQEGDALVPARVKTFEVHSATPTFSKEFLELGGGVEN